ncbi:MAG: hypothetical protein MK198_09240 [Gracilimonas sp.]|uniref:type II toxin-antitoxin system VapC family toxin n=1 Tax=Gracilimonas sp. TaxID=1974203 RepID=UPI0037502E6E|nr:hypothetical protein [Gracilimonas sp.]
MTVLIDTGPLYAFFDKNDQWHEWSLRQLSQLKPPFITCEAVITETLFLLNRSGIETTPLFKLFNRNLLNIHPVIHNQAGQKQIRIFMENYKNLPASFADSCLMYLSEITSDSRTFTLDTDFTIYRNKKGRPVKLIIPDIKS